ncbi:MAG: phage major capsid protein [Rhizobiales bacterium]|nr:phage major capsid protein [Hyphomicrobiales bacterium]
MSTFQEIKAAIDKQMEAFEAFKQTNDERLKAVGDGNEAKAKELGEKLIRIEADVQKFGEIKKQLDVEMTLNRERLEELESRAKSPGKTAEQKRADEYKDCFFAWMRNKGQSPHDEAKLHEIQKKRIEAKDITIGSPSGGGFAVPEEIAREIERLELKFSPVRRLVKVVRAGSSDYKELVNIRGATSGWVGESGSRTATSTPQLREVAPTHGELYAYPQASEWSLDDMFFNVDAWLAEEVAQEFAIQEGDAVIRGNGTSKPTGMLNTTPTTAADFASPLRAAAAYQFIPCLSDDSPAVAEILPDCLIDLIYTLNSAYRSGANFTMNSVTTGAIRKLKDADGQYLWQPGLQAGQPDRLLGYMVETWEQMDDIATNNFPVAFGNFRRGYVLADRVGLRITRDNVTNVGFVRFYVRRREGGIVLNNDAIKWLRTTIA